MDELDELDELRAPCLALPGTTETREAGDRAGVAGRQPGPWLPSRNASSRRRTPDRRGGSACGWTLAAAWRLQAPERLLARR